MEIIKSIHAIPRLLEFSGQLDDSTVEGILKIQQVQIPYKSRHQYVLWYNKALYIKTTLMPCLLSQETNTSLCVSFAHGCPGETHAIGGQAC